jgi:F0F1-type ATP synthase membrane subunit b/b'
MENLFWTIVWSIVVALIFFVIIMWLLAAFVNMAMGNPIGRFSEGIKSG